MINIFNNFCELETTDNIAVLKKLDKVDKQDVSKFTPEILEKMIHFKILSNDKLQKVDHFLEITLKLFPQLFPYIILKHTQSSFKLLERKEKFNNKQQNNVNDKITKNKPADDIFNSYNEKLYFSNGEANKCLDLIDNDFTFKDIENEILKIVQAKLHQEFNDEERKKLSKIITAEIYLRTNLPEEYIHTGEFQEFKNAYTTAIRHHNIQIIEKLEIAQSKGSGKEELCILLQKELLK